MNAIPLLVLTMARVSMKGVPIVAFVCLVSACLLLYLVYLSINTLVIDL